MKPNLRQRHPATCTSAGCRGKEETPRRTGEGTRTSRRSKGGSTPPAPGARGDEGPRTGRGVPGPGPPKAGRRHSVDTTLAVVKERCIACPGGVECEGFVAWRDDASEGGKEYRSPVCTRVLGASWRPRRGMRRRGSRPPEYRTSNLFMRR